MDGAWLTSLDAFWRSPGFPMWLTLTAAGFFAVLMLTTLLHAEKSVANGALTVITLLAVGVAVAATMRSYGPSSRFGAVSDTGSVSSAPNGAVLPALSCLDDLAGDLVLAACEKAVFASPESTAAAVGYAARQISRLTALGDAATATRRMTPELQALRRSIEHDRYGLIAQVLQAREHCTPTECRVFHSLTDNHEIITNMDEHLYERIVTRYAASWSAPPTTGAVNALAGFPPSMPTGKPTNADFPSAASTPPVSIMAPEPGTGTSHGASQPANANAAAAHPSPSPSQSPAVASAKKPAPKPRPAPAPAPTLLTPTPAPAASTN
jgi:hypothetical protein